MTFKLFDLLIIFLVTILITLYAFFTLSRDKDNTFVRVEVEGKKFIYSLDSDKEVIIEGELGVTTFIIKDKKVKITDSPCSNKTCIHSGSISKANRSIACLPNKIVITIDGEKDEIDGITF